MLDEYSIEQRATQILDAPSKESGRRNWGMAVNIGEQIGEQIAKSHCQFDLKSKTCGDDSVDASQYPKSQPFPVGIFLPVPPVLARLPGLVSRAPPLRSRRFHPR